MMSFPVRLVCPRCRGPRPEGGLRVGILDDRDRCPGCGAEHSRLEGIRRVLPRPLDEWPPGEDPEWPDRAVAIPDDPASPEFREAKLAAIYAVTHFPRVVPHLPWIDLVSENEPSWKKFGAWIDRHDAQTEAVARCALDVGCGPGRTLVELSGRFPDGTVGLDIRLSMLRLARRFADGRSVTLPLCTEGLRFESVEISPEGPAPGPVFLVQGDVLDPPFEPEVFPLISAFSLLDTVLDPVCALGQLDALLCPGGLLLLAQPWHWEADVNRIGGWWSDAETTGPDALRSMLSGASPLLPHLDYDLLEEEDGIPWTLPGHGRLIHRYFLHAVLARKRS